MWNWLTSAGSYIKFLCWVGWHMWEYVYSDQNWDAKRSESCRECKRCGVKQIKLQGKWKNGR